MKHSTNALRRSLFPSSLDVSRDFGYTQETLETIFELVEDPAHWKGPVDAFVEVPAEVDLGQAVDALREAVRYFTATEAVVTREGRELRVEADGYWMGPAN